MSTYLHDPQAVLDYGFNWDDWLQAGETLTETTWSITSEDEAVPTLAKDSDSFESTGGVTAWLSGGTHGIDYRVTCHIVTSAGRKDDRSHTLKVRQR